MQSTLIVLFVVDNTVDNKYIGKEGCKNCQRKESLGTEQESYNFMDIPNIYLAFMDTEEISFGAVMENICGKLKQASIISVLLFFIVQEQLTSLFIRKKTRQKTP